MPLLLRPPLPLGRAPAALIATLGAAAPVAAQALSGSESYTALAQQSVGSGGSALATSSAVEHALSPTAAGPLASSESYLLATGAVWTEPALGTDAPVLLGVDPPQAAAAGGTALSLRGLNFTSPGAGSTAVAIAGLPATGLTVVGPNEVQVTAPAGVDGVGNPLGPADVVLGNAHGSSTASEGLLYLPALVQHSPAQVGDPLAIHMRTAPGSFALLWFGVGVDGAPPIQLAGFDGGAALVLALTVVVPGSLLPSGELGFPIDVPDQPSLVGATVEFQGLAVTDLFAPSGSFTNVLEVQLQS